MKKTRMKKLTSFQLKVQSCMNQGMKTSREIADELHANETYVSEAMDIIESRRFPNKRQFSFPTLKSCPCCGGAAEWDLPQFMLAEAKCCSCGLKVQRYMVNDQTLQVCIGLVTDVWNTRTVGQIRRKDHHVTA